MSQQGGSFLICQLAGANLIKVCANQHVLEEAERNLLLKSPQKLAAYFHLLKITRPETVKLPLPKAIIEKINAIMPAKDIPVVAGALNAKADFLISLDKKHILQPNLKDAGWPFEIASPKEFLEIFRTQL